MLSYWCILFWLTLPDIYIYIYTYIYIPCKKNLWNYLLCILVYYYSSWSSLLDFELHGYCRKKIRKQNPSHHRLTWRWILYIYVTQMEENPTYCFRAIITFFRRVSSSPLQIANKLLLHCKKVVKICTQSSICNTEIFALYVSVFIYIQRDLYSNSHTSSTPVKLYDISHIFYILIIPNT